MTKADGDLVVAELLLAQEFIDASAFHIQQCAEKVLKEILVATRRRVPKVHDLALLAELVGEQASSALDIDEIGQMTSWAVATRYSMDDYYGLDLAAMQQAIIKLRRFLVQVRRQTAS